MGVNYLAILVSSVVSFMIGMVWYSPVMYGKAWMKLMGVSDKDKEKSKHDNMGRAFFISFISSLVMFYVLNYLMELLGYADAKSGAILGAWIWLGFFATSMLGSVLWDNKPLTLYLINAFHYLAVLLAGGAIIG